MKTEARKAYESKMPLSEVFLREEIQQQKHYLMLCKKMLANWNDLATGDPKGLTYRDANYIASQINDLLDSIKAHKRVLQVLKNGLPQRRPKGVMAKCPRCGAKKGQTVDVRTKDGWLVLATPALTAYDYKDEGVVVAQCCKCGASIKLDNKKYTVQDAIDAWNRRA